MVKIPNIVGFSLAKCHLDTCDLLISNYFIKQSNYVMWFAYRHCFVRGFVCRDNNIFVIEVRGACFATFGTLESAHWIISFFDWLKLMQLRHQHHVMVFFVFLGFEVRDGYSFCWYWWNGLPSLCKTTFQKIFNIL